MTDLYGAGKSIRTLRLIFGLVAAAIIAGAFAYFRYYRASLEKERADLLTSIAQAKAGEIAGWRDERLRDLVSLLDSPILSVYIARYGAAPSDRQTADLLKKRLQAFIRNNHYRGAYLAGTNGKLYLQAGETMRSEDLKCPEALELVTLAAAGGGPYIGELHLRKSDGSPALHLAARVWKGPAGRTLVLLLSADPREYLFPLVQRWPTNSPTAETMLVRKDGNTVLFLNELRHRKDTAIKFRLPLSAPYLPAALALRGSAGIIRGKDYRGHRVLAYAAAVRGSDWVMLAKVDESEIYSDLRRYSILLLLLVAALLAAAGAGTFLIIGRQRAEYSRGLREAEAERERYRVNYETLAEKASDAILLVDLDGVKVLEANPKAGEIYGYPKEELRGLPMEELVPPAQREDFRARTNRNVAEGSRHYEAEHRRKNGTVFPAEISATVLGLGGKKLMFSIVRDLTGRRKSETLIRENEAIFNSFLRHSPVYIFFKDKDLRALKLSANYGQMLGMPVEKALGRTMDELFPSELSRNMMADDRRVLEEGKPVTVRETLNGRAYETTKFPVLHEGKPLLLAGFTVDITEREKAERALRESERRLSTLISNLPGIAYRCRADEKWTMEFLSEGCLALTGYAAADLVSSRRLNFTDLVLPEDKRKVWETVQEAIKENRPYKLSYRIRRLSGEVRTVWEEGTAVRDESGAVTALEGLITDITDLKRAEAERDSVLERLNLAADSAHLGIWDWDLVNNVLVWDDRMLELYGLKKEQFKGAYEAWLHGLHPEDRARCEDEARRAIEGGTAAYTSEFRVVRPDGAVRHIKADGAIFRDAAGKALRMVGVNQDVTERKQAELKLQESEERLRVTLEETQIGTWDWNVTEDVWQASATYFTMLGYKPESGPSDRKAWLQRVHPDDRGMVAGRIKGVLDGVDAKYQYEARMLHADGTYRWHSVLGKTTARGPDGKPSRIMGVRIDIHERRRNDEINAARMRLMQFAAEHSLDELLEETLNETENLTGSLIGFYHFVDEDRQDLTLQNWSTRTKAEFCTAEGKGRHYPITQAGVWVDCVYQRKPVIHNDYASLPHRKGLPPGHAEVKRELVVPVLRKDRIVAILGVGNKGSDYVQADVEAVSLLADLAWEIAVRKRTEEALSESEQKYRSIYEESFDGLFLTSPEGRILDMNKKGIALFGYASKEEVLALDLARDVYAYPPDRARILEMVNSHGTAEYDVVVKRKDGEKLTTHCALTAVSDASGAIRMYRGIIRDVTEQRRAEEERETYARHLAEKNKELEDFLYIASHDLRSPMVNIQGFSQNLLKYCDEILAAVPPASAADGTHLGEVLKRKMPEALKFLLGSAGKMDSLINALLKVSRLGRAEMNQAPVDMDRFMAELAGSMAFQIKEAGAEMKIAPLPQCIADKTQLSQVFSNLIENSLKYRSPDRRPVIEVTGVLTEDGWAEYSVSDNGPGITEEEAAGRIWTPFYRAAPRGEVKGEGLGLTAARRIVERHGGAIRAARPEGGGARFTIKLRAWRQDNG